MNQYPGYLSHNKNVGGKKHTMKGKTHARALAHTHTAMTEPDFERTFEQFCDSLPDGLLPLGLADLGLLVPLGHNLSQ